MREAREKQFPRVSQQELADRLGLSRNQVANYESDRTHIPGGLLEKLADWWSLPPGYFGVDQIGPVLEPVSIASRSPHINLIPYWGQVPCGDWERPGDDEDWIQVSESIEPKGVIAVKVSGNSMAPRLIHGQTVVIKLDKTPRDGLITLATNNQNELTLKVLKFVSGEWQLHSINPEHGIVSAESWEVLGYAIAIEEHDAQGIRP